MVSSREVKPSAIAAAADAASRSARPSPPPAPASAGCPPGWRRRRDATACAHPGTPSRRSSRSRRRDSAAPSMRPGCRCAWTRTELPQRLLILGLGILLDREGVAAIERPLQHLRTGVAATGQDNADHVQLVVVSGLNAVHAQAPQRVTQLGVRQAGSDDRAVQRVGKLPESCCVSETARTSRSEGTDARRRTSARRSSLISGGSAVAARKLVGMGGSSDTIRLAISV